MTNPKEMLPILLLITLHCVHCILNSQDARDITGDYNFNCRWLGGRDPKLHCNCLGGTEEFIIMEHSIPAYDVSMINITNCGKLTLEANAISNMRSLRAISLENIKSIVLKEDSLFWVGYIRTQENLVDWDPSIPSLRIRIAGSRVDSIANNAIHGRINLVEIIYTNVRHMSPFAISKLQQMLNVRIEGTTFGAIEPQSFKKFTTENLIVTNTVFETIPSRAFYDLTVRNEFKLDNITVVDTLKPSGFMITDPYRFELTNSHINALSGDGFKVRTRGPVTIRSNTFNTTGNGAFRSISLYKGENPNAFETIRFERNIFHHLSKDALLVDKSSFRAEFLNLQLSEVCECGNLDRYFRHGENTLELSCLLEMANEGDAKEWVSVDHFQSTRCGMLDTKGGTVYIIAGVCAIALVLAGGFVGLYFLRLHRSKSYGKEAADTNGKLSMIVPDGRTYRETELHVIVERTDLLTTDL